MIKRAYTVQMTYNVSNSEKKIGEKTLMMCDKASKKIKEASEYLDLIKTPFKENPESDKEKIFKQRAALRRFRDNAIKKYNDFNIISFLCVKLFNFFSSDIDIEKILKSFISSIDELKNKVNNFAELFNNFDSKDFTKDIVSSIEDIQKKSDDIFEILDERIKNHIQKNILARNWVDSVSDDLQVKIDKKQPLLVELFNKRYEDLVQKKE